MITKEEVEKYFKVKCNRFEEYDNSFCVASIENKTRLIVRQGGSLKYVEDTDGNIVEGSVYYDNGVFMVENNRIYRLYLYKGDKFLLLRDDKNNVVECDYRFYWYRGVFVVKNNGKYRLYLLKENKLLSLRDTEDDNFVEVDELTYKVGDIFVVKNNGITTKYKLENNKLIKIN